MVDLGTIDFLIYSRATRRAAEVGHDPALDEEHWSYMDAFADGMIARGPTLAADRETWTGSVHILDLPSAEAAREFVKREPYNRAGLFEHHLIRRFTNLLGRTMWDAPGGSDDPRFLVIAHVRGDAYELARRRTALPGERLIVHGELLTPDEGRRVGAVWALQAPARAAVEAAVSDRLGALYDVQVLDWEFGGRH